MNNDVGDTHDYAEFGNTTFSVVERNGKFAVRIVEIRECDSLNKAKLRFFEAMSAFLDARDNDFNKIPF
jgi:uncharacterized protein YunC (DUF1805 family)